MEIKKMLPEIVKARPLCRILRVVVQIAEPHTAILPESESNGLHTPRA